MVIGYARVSKADGSQSLDPQRDALVAEGVDRARIYEDRASGATDDRPGLEACLQTLRGGDVLVVWKLDPLGRNLAHLVGTVQDLSDRGVGLRVLAGKGGANRHDYGQRPLGVRDLRSAGRVRAGAHPRAHGGGTEGRAGARPVGSSHSPKLR